MGNNDNLILGLLNIIVSNQKKIIDMLETIHGDTAI